MKHHAQLTQANQSLESPWNNTKPCAEAQSMRSRSFNFCQLCVSHPLLQTSIFLVEPNPHEIVSKSSTVKLLNTTIDCLGHLMQVVWCMHETTPSLADFTTPLGLSLMLNNKKSDSAVVRGVGVTEVGWGIGYKGSITLARGIHHQPGFQRRRTRQACCDSTEKEYG